MEWGNQGQLWVMVIDWRLRASWICHLHEIAQDCEDLGGDGGWLMLLTTAKERVA
jgi:hypothetical protein